jgi:TPR repeat protein
MDEHILARLIASSGAERDTVYTEQLDKLAGDPFARFQWSKYAAILDVRDAVKEVVAAYKEGIGTEPDQIRAFEWMKKGAEVLQITSLYFDLALAYRDGLGTLKNIEKFWEFMGKAAKLKEPEAMFQLAEAHTQIELGQKSPERAAEWTIKGVAEGDPTAIIKLARRHQLGDGVKRDLNEFFKYAQQAVESAKYKWDLAKNPIDGEEARDWAYEDYPDALVALAEAYRERGDQENANKTTLLAADVAYEAIKVAQKMGDTVNAGKSKSLPDIMLGRLREFRTQKGEINKWKQTKYFDWLRTIDDGLQQVYFTEDGPKSIPYGLIQATFELAIAYEQGIGTHIDITKSHEYMARAAKAGHGEAAYRCAMRHYEANDHLQFTEFLTLGAPNDFRARHALALVDCELPKNIFLPTLDSLAALQDAVHQIRSSRHTMTSEEKKGWVAHYTDGGGLASMLGNDLTEAKNVIRLYNIAYVNDPMEGKRLRTFKLSREPNPLDDFFNKNENLDEAISWQGQEFLVFIACFSLSFDELDLWRAYGRDGTGYSIATPAKLFDTDSTYGMLRTKAWAGNTNSIPPFTLYKVLYDDSDAEKALHELAKPLSQINSIIKKAPTKASENVRKIAAAIVSELLYLYKEKDYRQEKEVRAVEARTVGDPELKQHVNSLDQFAKLFIETKPLLFQPGSSIIIGPKVKESAAIMIDIKHRLEKSGFMDCNVGKSKVPYR